MFDFKIEIEKIPTEIIDAGKKAREITLKIEQSLEQIQKIENSDVTSVIASLFPSGSADLAIAKEVTSVAVLSIHALLCINDANGVKGLLQRLGANLTSLFHGKLHSMSDYIKFFEIIFNLPKQ